MKLVQIKQTIKRVIDKPLYWATYLFLLAVQPGFADGIIPESSVGQTSSGTDFSTTAVNILQKDVIPFVELIAAMGFIWIAISTMFSGIKSSREKQEFTPMKEAIVTTVIAIVFGGALLYLLELARTHNFS